MIGASLTHYRITAKLGQGGMGEVYRATDTKLGRDVAIKVLPAAVSRDPQSVSRFEREARALAALNHPHVAAIYGFDADGGTHFLVLELVEGETLAERLRHGPLRLDEALVVARQIAEALEEAHSKGIVHRDLKPGNVKITPSGRVKVLDFGLAKMEQALVEPAGVESAGTGAEDSPTLPADGTVAGTVMGTPAYMSPEQARGQSVDRRTDVWAFGCCLYECLAGQKPFPGQTTAELMAEVLTREPDWSLVPPETPREVITLLRRCLEKDPARRLSSIGDIALTLDESTRGPAAPSSQSSPAARPVPESAGGAPARLARKLWPVAAALGALLLGVAIYYAKRPASPGPANRSVEAGVTNGASSAGVVPGANDKSVAVLAFANLSEDKSNEYFSDGVSEELLNVLAKIPGLKVSARTSAFAFKGKNMPISEIARQLGVAYVVEGSVRKSGDRVRITAQLIKAADGFHVWSDNFTREVKDIFAVQDEIAGLIAQNLSLKMGVPSAGPSAVDPEVSRLYFEARQLWSLRSDEALAQMEALLTHALELDPRFAPAEAGLAQVSVARAFVKVAGARYLEVELANVTQHATKAIELDPNSAEGFEALGTAALVRGELSEAENALQRSVELNPNYAPGWNKQGWLLVRQGSVERGLEKFAKARELDPLVWPMIDGHAIALLENRRYADAAATFAQARALPVCGPVTWANSGVALLLSRRNEEALAAVRVVTHGNVKGDWNRGLWDWSDGLAAWVLAEAGASEEARVIVARLSAGPEAQRFAAGFALVALGREDEGFTALERLPQQLIMYLWLLFQRHEALATTPRFQDLLSHLNAAEAFHTLRATLDRVQSAAQSQP